MHKTSPLARTLNECTMHQRVFLNLMAIDDINYQNSIEHKLIGIAKGVGIEFKNNASRSSRNESQGFHDKMKKRQEKYRQKLGLKKKKD